MHQHTMKIIKQTRGNKKQKQQKSENQVSGKTRSRNPAKSTGSRIFCAYFAHIFWAQGVRTHDFGRFFYDFLMFFCAMPAFCNVFQWFSIVFQRFLSIFHRFSVIFIDFCRFSTIFGYTRPFLATKCARPLLYPNDRGGVVHTCRPPPTPWP